MAKVYAGVDSLRLSQIVGIGGSVADYRENTTVKFGSASFKPAGSGSGVFSSGALQRTAAIYNSSDSSSTIQYRRTGFFTNPTGPQYAWDCWVYLNSANSGKTGATDTPSIFSWPAENVSGSGRAFQLQPTASDEISLVITNSSNVTQETLTTINASSFSETNFLGAWWWIAFQRNGQDFDIWMGKSGTATNIYSATKSYTYDSEALDNYRIGCSGTPTNNASSPIDGFIDEVAVRKGLPFSGTVSCPTGAYTGNEDGMVDLYHFDTTGNTFPSNAAGSINQTSGSNIGGTFNEYLQTFNPNATSTQLNDISAFGSIGYTAFRLGEVTVTALVPPTVELTGVSGSTSLGDLVPENQVVGVSLKAFRGGSLANSGSLVTSPIPFSGLRSVNCGSRSQLSGLYLPSLNKFEYSFYNDFTIECFLRGDGTTNDGGFLNFDIEMGTNNPGELNFMIDGDELMMNNYEFPGTGYRKKIGVDIGTRTTTDWYHFACVRKDNKYSLFWNGNRVAYDVDSAGNGTADTINIDSDDAYLFKPFGGNNAINQGRLPAVLLGLGGNKPSDQSGNFFWGGYIANYRTSYIAQYDPSSSTYTVPSAAFSNFSGTTTYYKDATNNDFYNESDNLPTTFNDLDLTSSIGSVTVSLESIIDVTGQSLSLSYNPATGLPSKDVDVTGQSLSTSLGTITDKQGFEAFGSLLQSQEGTVDVQIELLVPVTGQNLTTSLGAAFGGPNLLAPTTGQNLTISLGNINIPVSWAYVSTGTTSTWTPVDTGEKAIGP